MEEPGLISDKSYPLEVSALWFLHKIPFILCLGRGVLSVETSDRREGLAADKTMFLKGKSPAVMPVFTLRNYWSKFKNFCTLLQNLQEKGFCFPDKLLSRGPCCGLGLATPKPN